MTPAQQMKLKTKIKKAVRRNERKMTTKKAKRALGTVAMAIFAMLAIQTFITVANSSKTITIENSKNWGVRESLENVADQSAMSTDKDGVVADSREETKLVEAESPSEVVRMIEEKFPEEKKLITAVFKAESGHNPKSMGWNCRYTENGKTVSKACKPEDRHKAWSVDCGVAQINTIGQTCPEELFEVEHNLTVAKKMYDTRGLNPWMAYLNGSYKKHL